MNIVGPPKPDAYGNWKGAWFCRGWLQQPTVSQKVSMTLLLYLSVDQTRPDLTRPVINYVMFLVKVPTHANQVVR